MSNNRLK